jgi:hypothetical protein
MKQYYDLICEMCGKKFIVEYKYRKHRFCSNQCSQKNTITKRTFKKRKIKRTYPNIRTSSKPTVKYSNIRRRAIQHKWDYPIYENFKKWYEETEKKCFYCDIPLEIWKKLFNGHQNKYSLSIDRKNNAIGYVTNNLVFACSKCNVSKNDLFDSVEWREIAQKYIKPKWQAMLIEGDSKCSNGTGIKN